jgi:hypothetical protein
MLASSGSARTLNRMASSGLKGYNFQASSVELTATHLLCLVVLEFLNLRVLFGLRE